MPVCSQMIQGMTKSYVPAGGTVSLSDRSRESPLVDHPGYGHHFLTGRQTGAAFENFVRRFAAVPDDERVCATIISFEEHMRGWLAQIAAARKPEVQVLAYARLQRLLWEYQSRDTLPYDDAAAVMFARLHRNRIRIGTMDLRIGAIALTDSSRQCVFAKEVHSLHAFFFDRSHEAFGESVQIWRARRKLHRNYIFDRLRH